MAQLYQRRYIIVNFNDITDSLISKVFQTSIQTLRKSIDETKAILSYNYGDKPESVLDSTEYNHNEILNIVSGSDWSNDSENI